MKPKKPIYHLGGFAGPLPCNGSSGGVTTARPNEVTCKRCKAMLKSGSLMSQYGLLPGHLEGR